MTKSEKRMCQNAAKLLIAYNPTLLRNVGKISQKH